MQSSLVVYYKHNHSTHYRAKEPEWIYVARVFGGYFSGLMAILNTSEIT
jgi:hypothetical protein